MPVEKLAKPLVEAAAAGNAEVFKALVDPGADVKALVVEAGADAGADDKEDTEYKGCTLLWVSAVLDLGADANEKNPSSDRSPLCQALSPPRGNEEVARRLVVAGADVNPPGTCSPLSLAVSFEKLAEDLLLKGADPNLNDEKVGYPLTRAASIGLPGTVSKLLRPRLKRII